MKILHIVTVRKLTNGQRLQLESEEKSAKLIENIDWDIHVYHTDKCINDFEQLIPKFFQFPLLRYLYGWIKLLEVSKKYDIVLQRRMPYDPFGVILGWFVSNRYTVHHSMEINEMKLIKTGITGKIASMLEKITGYVNARQIKGFLGVTKEIAEFENSVFKTFLPIYSYPNGILTDNTKLIDDNRDKNEINILFMAGTFTLWSGLDLLLDAVQKDIKYLEKNNVKIHLVGNVKDREKIVIENINNSYPLFNIYGHVNSNKYREVMSRCDIGLGSLALIRQGMNEGSTLKVKEYLNLGLPVYSGHKDTAIEDDYTFYIYENDINLSVIVDFAIEMRSYTRDAVHNSSIQYIDKKILMEKFILELDD